MYALTLAKGGTSRRPLILAYKFCALMLGAHLRAHTLILQKSVEHNYLTQPNKELKNAVKSD